MGVGTLVTATNRIGILLLSASSFLALRGVKELSFSCALPTTKALPRRGEECGGNGGRDCYVPEVKFSSVTTVAYMVLRTQSC